MHQVFARGGQRIVSCSTNQFRCWYKIFSSKQEEDVELDDEDPEISKTVTKKVFTVEQKPLKFLRAPGNFLSTPINGRLNHQSMMEHAVHLWRNGKTAAENLDCVDYVRGGLVPSRYPGWTDTIDNIPRLVPMEKVHTDRKSKNSRPLMLRPGRRVWHSCKPSSISIPNLETLSRTHSMVHIQSGERS